MSYNNIGILDPEGLNINPLTGFNYRDIYRNDPDTPPPKDETGQPMAKTYSNYAKWWSKLPVYERKMSLLQNIEKNRVTLIKAGTGSGKTVLVPVFALHALNYEKKVAVCIPRVIPVKSSSAFAATRLDVEYGDTVGYSAGGEKFYTDNTMLLYCTTGFLVQKMSVGGDPYLKDLDCVIIDEVHERQSDTDFLMYLLRRVLDERPEFKVIIMSATIDFTIFQNYFKNYGYGEFDAGGKTTFPITQYFEDKELKKNEWKKAAIEKAVHILTTTTEGDILIFTPGKTSVQLCNSLETEMSKYMQKNPDSKIVPFCVKLESGVDKTTEKLATDISEFKNYTKPSGYNEGKNYTRKVVMSTNVAESSLTVDGLKYVIDSGLEQESDFNYRSNCSLLVEKFASQSSITQRKGRGGRTGPGVCYHLYTKEQFDKLDKYSKPSIFREDYWKTLERGLNLPYISTVGDIIEFSQSFIESPKKEVVNFLIKKLYHLGYFTSTDNDGVLTYLGKAMIDLNKDPSFTKSLIASYYYGIQQYIIPILLLQENVNNSQDILNDKMANRDNTYKNQFKNTLEELKNDHGDVFSLFHVYTQYENIKKELKENQGFNDEEIKNQIRIWSERHFMNGNIFESKNESIKKRSTELREKLKNIMDSFIDEEYDVRMKDVLKLNYDIEFMNTIENPIYKILLTLFEGYCVYGCKKKGNKEFRMLYPKKKKKQESTNLIKKPGNKVIIPENNKSKQKLYGAENTFLKIKNDIVFGMKFFSRDATEPLTINLVNTNNIPDPYLPYIEEKYKDLLNLNFD